MIRAVILSATIAALICMWEDRKPVAAHIAHVDYCKIDMRVGATQFGMLPDGRPALDKNGKQLWRLHSEWVKGWGLCSDLDRYEFI